MKKKIICATALTMALCLYQNGDAQNIYVDPTTSLALATYSSTLKSEQNKTIDEQNKLQKAQAFVSAQMTVANDIQNKLYKGLREVSGTLQNGVQIERIYENLTRLGQYTSDVASLASKHPQFIPFANKATQQVQKRMLQLGVDVSDIITGSDTNLATAGDRFKLLMRINQDITQLKIAVLMVKMSLQRAINLGFWKAINPFQRYFDTDRYIVQQTMAKYKHQF